jgi:alpha-beta hydrolase superfamily lysophospholipase
VDELAGAQSIRDVIAEDAERVRSGHLQADCASRFFPSQRAGPSCGVVLMFHGFAGGAFQCDDVGQALAADGLHVFVPRLAGHGAQLRGGDRGANEMPLSHETDLYAATARRAMHAAAPLAESDHVGLGAFGFSLGGSLALDLALHYPQTVERLMLAAPLLKEASMHARRLHLALHVGKHLGLQRLYNVISHAWGPTPAAAERMPGHWRFRLGNLYAALSYARQVHQDSMALTVPTQVVISEGDRMCDQRQAEDFLRHCDKAHWLYAFRQAEHVPHVMLSRREKSPPQAVKQIAAIASLFFRAGVGQNSDLRGVLE